MKGSRELNRRWNRRLVLEGLGVNRGLDDHLIYAGLPNDLGFPDESYWPEEDEEGHRVIGSSHGLVSSVYSMAASGDYMSLEESVWRNKAALKDLVAEHGKDFVEAQIKLANLTEEDEPSRTMLLFLLAGMHG